jgi:hypothetical protein
MDRDIYEINRAFLLKAREFAIHHGDHRARYTLGISMELAAFLRRISISQVNVLAEASISCFTIRIPPSTLRQMEFMIQGDHLDDLGRCQILASTLKRENDAHQN